MVIIAVKTNGYIEEEILSNIGQKKEYSRKRFFRAIVLPPSNPLKDYGWLPDAKGFPVDNN